MYRIQKPISQINIIYFNFQTSNMGGQSSKSKRRVKNPVQQNWEVIQTVQNFNIVRNKTDGRQAEQHFFTLENRYDPSNEAHIYQRRIKTSLPLVKVLDHQWQAKGSSLLPKNNFRVITQRLPHRLSQCPQLSFDQSLYILDKALQGYSFLYHSLQPFDINSNMIGFTQQGEVKVWLNENFGRNYPYHQKRTLQSTRIDETHKYNMDYVPLEEIEMVRNIINVIEDRCEEGQFPEEFRERVRQNIGFEEARKIVEQEWMNPAIVRVNRVDLYRNVVKSKISKLQPQQTLAQTAITHTSNVQINPTASYMMPNAQYTQQVQPIQYQSTYIPVNQPGKNAFSFSYQRPVQA